LPNLIAVGQMVRTYGLYGDRLEKLGLSRPAFQGHSRSSKLTWIVGIDRQPTTSTLHSNHVSILYHFEDTARYQPRIMRIFPTQPFFNAPAEGCPGNWATPDGLKEARTSCEGGLHNMPPLSAS